MLAEVNSNPRQHTSKEKRRKAMRFSVLSVLSFALCVAFALCDKAKIVSCPACKLTRLPKVRKPATATSARCTEVTRARRRRASS